MTLYKDGTVDYTATFFALVRTGLKIYTDNGTCLLCVNKVVSIFYKTDNKE